MVQAMRQSSPKNVSTQQEMMKPLFVPENINRHDSSGGARGNQSRGGAYGNRGCRDPQCIRGIRVKWNVGNGINFGVELNHAVGAGDPRSGIADNKSRERSNRANRQPLQ